MADIQSWGWYVPAPWPFMETNSQTNLDESANGLSVDPAGYIEYTIRDANNDGIVYDADQDGGPRPTNGDILIGPTKTLYPQEIALYTNSTIVMNGQTLTGLDMEVTLFTDGTYGVRLMDWDIPQGHYSSVTSITLGQWNGIEYSGINIAGVDQMFVCFAAGTQILTARGFVSIENLKLGDMVETLDDGLQPIRWIGRSCVMGLGKQAPIRIAAGTFDNHSHCYVSPNHRILVQGEIPELLFGEDEVLVAAKHLVDGDRIRPEPRTLIEYYHFALDQHHVVVADGLMAETLLPGPEALELIGPEARRDLIAAMPRLGEGWHTYGPAARLCLSACEAQVLTWAHIRQHQLETKVNGRTRPEYTFID